LTKKGKSTQAIHGRRDDKYRGVVYPIYASATFGAAPGTGGDYAAATDEEWYIYSRYSNPTVRNVEERLARLENTDDAVLFASGMAAITTTFLTFVRGGDTIVAPRRLFGVTYHFLRDLAPQLGIKVCFLSEDELYRAHEIAPEAKLIYFETPVNPTSDCISIPRVVEAARQTKALLAMDSTFASPINQNPADFGVDVVLHSATKYIGGHSDLLAGAAIGWKEPINQVRTMMGMLGGICNPLDAYLLDRSLKTMPVRVMQQNRTAMVLANFFAAEPKVKRVFYPGLENSPSHEVATTQMRGYGGMLAIELANLDAAKKFCGAVQVAFSATSLGSVETLVSLPITTSHAGMSHDELRAAGVTPGMVRISVGLEDADDLIADFKQACAAV
jgi:cystathionine beta-lyase/cystathionine gamma-synthase